MQGQLGTSLDVIAQVRGQRNEALRPASSNNRSQDH